MTIKSLKRFTKILNKTEGVSLLAIIILMVIMAMMGGVFSTIMGTWKLSAPSTINSIKSFYLAETAAMFALQDASYRFYGGSFNYGASDSPYVVSSSITETADYWFERPGVSDDVTTGVNDDDVDDDDDDSSNSTLYSIIATGKVLRDGTTVAKRQIKIKATITKLTNNIEPGVYTEGIIQGGGPDGNPQFDITNGLLETSFAAGDNNNIPNPDNEDGIVYREPPVLDRNEFKTLSTNQGHNQSGSPFFTPDNDYPNTSYYYDAPTDKMPNITYIDGNLKSTGDRTIYGIYWVTGWVSLSGGTEVHGIIICEGNVTLHGGAGEEIDGGIIQYGATNTLETDGMNIDITINTGFFDDFNDIAIVAVASWQEAVSAN